MTDRYQRLYLDPRCLKPSYDVNDRFVYTDALDAIDTALNHPYITESEKKIIEKFKEEITKNRFAKK